MQDCIDGIIPMLFDEPYSDELMILPFGMDLEQVVNTLNERGLELINLKDVNEEIEKINADRAAESVTDLMTPME